MCKKKQLNVKSNTTKVGKANTLAIDFVDNKGKVMNFAIGQR